MAIIADRYVEESNEEITSDISRDSLLPEQLPEASFELEPTRSVPPRTIQTRTQTVPEQGIPQRRFSHFDYPSDSDSEPAMIESPNPDPTPAVVFPELDDLEPLLSDQEEIQSEEALARSLIPSPSGTSAPLLSNPSLTDTLGNFPLFNPNMPKPLAKTQQPPNTRAKTLNRSHLRYNQTPLADEDAHEVDPLAAETNAPLPQAEAPHLLRNQQYDPEKPHERDSLLEPHPEPMTEPRHCPKFSKTLRLINLTHLEIFRRKHQLPASSESSFTLYM